MARPEKVRLGEILVQAKLLSEDQLQFALGEQKRTGRKLGRVFVEKVSYNTFPAVFANFAKHPPNRFVDQIMVVGKEYFSYFQSIFWLSLFYKMKS